MYPSLTRFPGELFADFDGLQRQVEQLLGLRGAPSSIRAGTRGAFPALNVGTTEAAIEIYAFAPGLDPAKIAVDVDNGVLTLSGERPAEVPAADAKLSVYAQERFAGTFKRVLSLPEDADSAGVAATYRDGVLRISIPRRAPARPKRIAVQ